MQVKRYRGSFVGYIINITLNVEEDERNGVSKTRNVNTNHPLLVQRGG